MPVVTHADSAAALGSGSLPVLATPRLIAWLEAATVDACPPLDEGQTSVGTRIEVEHIAASPLGAVISARANVVHRDGRLLRFEVAAHHDIGNGPVLIAHGHITRVVVDADRFLARTSPALLIRAALPQEWPAIGALCVTAYSAGYGLNGDTDGYIPVLADVAGRAAQGDVLVALRDGELVGTVTVLSDGAHMAEVAREGEVEFRFMAVDPAAWKGGIARALVAEVIERAGTRPVVCSVIEGNEPAATLYASCGFEAAPERDREPAPGIRLLAFRRPASGLRP